MPELIDQLARDRFIDEIDQPFSVIAPAGVGKTHAIIGRVLRMLQSDVRDIALVTYTNKAAREMRQRLEERFSPLSPEIYERIFIGTIHSLCLDLMDRNGLVWGLPAKSEVIANPERLWTRYCEEEPNPLVDLPCAIQEQFLKYFKKFDSTLIMEAEPKISHPEEFLLPPKLNFDGLFKAEIKGSAKKTLERLKNWAEKHLEDVKTGQSPLIELPTTPEHESECFDLYEDCFGAYQKWKSVEGMRYAQHMSAKFTHWRRRKGLYLYDDLIAIVNEKTTANGAMSIVLDEAQDTSPAQLKLLIKLAGRRNGRLQLTMVGDPQQSIYSSRASLPHYLETHKTLIQEHGAVPLTFTVTFRCSESVVNWVNLLGKDLFSPSPSQAAFVTLQERPGATKGDVFRWKVPGQIDKDADSDERDWNFARTFSRNWIKLNIPRQRAHNIAILAPRKDWLFKLHTCLGEEGWAVQIHADGRSANIPERILRSIVHLMVYPFDSFELLGLLRELTVLDDRTLALVAQKCPEQLTLMTPPPDGLPERVAEVLLQFHMAWKNYLNKPFDEAIIGFIDDTGIDASVHALGGIYGGDLWHQWLLERSRVLRLAARGVTGRELLNLMDSGFPDRAIEPGSIQLMTMHKAKGLEWDVVVVPFLFRSHEPARKTYPVIDSEDRRPVLSWKTPSERIALSERDNFERLLYVAMTRAREQLILVDDSDFYDKEGRSAADILKISKGKAHYGAFMKLPGPAQLTLTEEDEMNLFNEPEGAKLQEIKRPMKVYTPSSLVQAQLLIGETEITPGGIDYGKFWHGLWNFEAHGALRENLLRRAAAGAFSARAQLEIERLFSTPLGAILTDPQNTFCTEYPFIALVDGKVFEGRADIVIRTPLKTLIVDWKTDRLTPAQIMEMYRPQLMAYGQSFKKIIGGDVAVMLYATAHGELLEWMDP